MAEFKQGAFTRDLRTVADTDEDRDTCIPLWRMDTEEYQDADGRQQWRDVEMVTIVMPGNNLTKPDQFVSDAHRKRWPKSYAAFKANQELPVTGTPLESWPRINKGQLQKLKSLGFRTVEDVARMHQQAYIEIGAGAQGMKLSAQAYLDDRQKMAITDKAIADAERFESKCSELEGQNARLNELLGQMNERLKRMEFDAQQKEQNVASTPMQPQASFVPKPSESQFGGFEAEERRLARRAELGAFNDGQGATPPPSPEAENITLQVPVGNPPKRRGRPPKAAQGG